MDIMDAKKIIEEIEAIKSKTCPEILEPCGAGMCKELIMNDFFQTVAGEPQKWQWRKCLDGLPPFDKDVLVVCKRSRGNIDIGVAYFNRKYVNWRWSLTGTEIKVDITHWMPLPEPPEDI
jgi:hypothetical protein